MARLYRDSEHRSKPWRAEVRREGQRFFLGCFETANEALLEEWAFKKGWEQMVKRVSA